MFDYSHLEALLAVEREKSIDGAARSLGVSASAISQRIKVLEERVGAIAVNRKKPVTPTEFGRNLCRHAEKVILLEQDLIDQNEQDFTNMEGEANIIKVAVDYTSISTWFVEALRSEAMRNNHVFYDVLVVESMHTGELMKHGTALAAISDLKSPIQGHRSMSLGCQTYKAVMTEAFAQRNFDGAVDVESLQMCSSIRRSPQDDLCRMWLSQNFDVEFELKGHTMPSTQGMLSAVMKGIAWAILPNQIVDPFIRSGQLVELIAGKSLNRPVYWHYGRAISNALRPLNQSVLAAAQKSLSPLPRSPAVNAGFA